MSDARLLIEQAGPLTTLQDAGRAARMREGIPRSGPIDRLAFAAANAALGQEGATAVELSLGGLTAKCVDGPLTFALCGGDFTAEIDATAAGGWTVATIDAGSRLRIRAGARGNWGYLAVAGRIDAPQWHRSSATLASAGLGGGILHAGRELVVRDTTQRPLRMLPQPPAGASIATARFVRGPQEDCFDRDASARFSAGTYTAGSAIDRMGMRLEGAPLLPNRLDMPSEPIVRGTLQVDGAGAITLLLADHQTTGGYPKIGVVLGADADRIAQLRPGSPLSFVAIDPPAAIAAARAAAERASDYLRRVIEAVGAPASLLDTNLIGGVIDALGDTSA